jgi:hypothetical protein
LHVNLLTDVYWVSEIYCRPNDGIGLDLHRFKSTGA